MDGEDRSKPPDGVDSSAQQAPKPYRPPTLVEYGSIAKLTRSGGSTSFEGSSGRRRMMFL